MTIPKTHAHAVISIGETEPDNKSRTNVRPAILAVAIIML